MVRVPYKSHTTVADVNNAFKQSGKGLSTYQSAYGSGLINPAMKYAVLPALSRAGKDAAMSFISHSGGVGDRLRAAGYGGARSLAHSAVDAAIKPKRKLAKKKAKRPF